MQGVQIHGGGGGFPNHITSLLESFYSGGLRGWGANYASQFQEALKSTSPSELQLKVHLFTYFYLITTED